MYKFEKLTVWKKAMDFSQRIYEISRNFPKEEQFGLTSQIRRAVTSIPLNIAEGTASNSEKEFIRFLYIALRSQYEVVTILKLAQLLKYLSPEEGRTLELEAAEIGRLLQGLINSLSLGSVQRTNDQQPMTKDGVS